MEKMDKLSPQSPSSGPRSSLTARSRNRTLAILAAVAALGGTACGGEDPNNDQPDGGAGAGAVDGGTGGTGAGGTGGEAGSNPCEGVPFEGLASKLYEPGETGAFTVEKDGPYKGMRFEMVNGEVVTEPTLVGLQSVTLDNIPVGGQQIGDLEATRVSALDGNQPFEPDGLGGCTFKYASLNAVAMADPDKQPTLDSPPGIYSTGLINADIADYSLQAENTRIKLSALTTSDDNKVDIGYPNFPPVGLPVLTRNSDNMLILDVTNVSDEGFSNEFVWNRFGVSIPNTTLVPSGQPGVWNSDSPYLDSTASTSISGLNEDKTNDTKTDILTLPEFPGIDNLAIDCNGLCYSSTPSYPGTFSVSDALNCTGSIILLPGSVGAIGSLSTITLNGTDGSFTWHTGSTPGDETRITINCTGSGGSDEEHIDIVRY